MLQQLTAATGAQVWAIGSMLFFFGFFLLVLYRIFTGKREEFEARARMPLDDGTGIRDHQPAPHGAEQPTEQGA